MVNKHKDSAAPTLPSWAQPLVDELATSGQDALIFFPGSAEFDDSETAYFTAQANEVPSAAVARPSSTAQVATSFKTLRRHLPKTVPIGVRGAGHARAANMAKAKDGVTIDMRGLKGIKISKRSNGSGHTVKISAGHEWGDVYSAPEKHDPPLSVPGGRNTGVGVAGFLLGGGISFFSYACGFGADAVRAWEVVLASGEIVRAARDDPKSADLWDALRGGSTNFGIVTSIEMDCVPHPQHFRASAAFYLSPAKKATLQALVDLGSDHDVLNTDAVPHAIWTITHVAGVPFKVIALLMSTTKAAGYGGLQGFVDARWRVPLTGTLKETRHSEWAQATSDMTPKGGSRGYHKAITVKLDADFLNHATNMWYKSVETLRHVSGIMYNFTFVPLPVSMLKASRDTTAASATASKTNAMGLSPEDGPLATVEMNFTWNKAEDDVIVFEEAAKFAREVAQAAEEKGMGHPFLFPNYASPDEPVMRSYGEERLAVLKSAAEKWDPERVFQDRITGGFKLSM